jgi:hypothetical protein
MGRPRRSIRNDSFFFGFRFYFFLGFRVWIKENDFFRIDYNLHQNKYKNKKEEYVYNNCTKCIPQTQIMRQRQLPP